MLYITARLERVQLKSSTFQSAAGLPGTSVTPRTRECPRPRQPPTPGPHAHLHQLSYQLLVTHVLPFPQLRRSTLPFQSAATACQQHCPLPFAAFANRTQCSITHAPEPHSTHLTSTSPQYTQRTRTMLRLHAVAPSITQPSFTWLSLPRLQPHGPNPRIPLNSYAALRTPLLHQPVQARCPHPAHASQPCHAVPDACAPRLRAPWVQPIPGSTPPLACTAACTGWLPP